jgi:hypothetical protein
MKRQWLIRGFDGLTKIFEIKISVGQLTDDQMKQMLKALTAKAGLEYREIVGAYAKRGTKIANDLLIVHRDSTTATFTVSASCSPARIPVHHAIENTDQS